MSEDKLLKNSEKVRKLNDHQENCFVKPFTCCGLIMVPEDDGDGVYLRCRDCGSKIFEDEDEVKRVLNDNFTEKSCDCV